jgi:hypothetical protein
LASEREEKSSGIQLSSEKKVLPSKKEGKFFSIF